MSMLDRATVSRTLIGSLLDAARRMGVDPGALGFRTATCLAPASARSRVSLAELADLWRSLRELTGEASVGLRLAEHMRTDGWDVFARAVGSSATLCDALVRAGRFMPLLVEGVDLGFLVSGDRGTVMYRGWAPVTQQRDSVELALGLIARHARLITGDRVRFESVSFTHEPPADLSPYLAVFGTEPEFGRPLNTLVVDSHVLHRPIPGYQAEPCAVAEQMAQDALTRMVRVRSIVRLTEEALRHELEETYRAATVDCVADKLGMPPRTLSRRLKAEGTTFQEILDSLRHHLADRYLSASRMSIAEVAYALGYSDPSAFNKAFRRWTGRAPHEYRQHATGSSRPPAPSGEAGRRPGRPFQVVEQAS